MSARRESLRNRDRGGRRGAASSKCNVSKPAPRLVHAGRRAASSGVRMMWVAHRFVESRAKFSATFACQALLTVVESFAQEVRHGRTCEVRACDLPVHGFPGRALRK